MKCEITLALVGPCGHVPHLIRAIDRSFQISYYSLAFFFYMFLPLASPLLFPCVSYAVADTHLVHEIPIP